ncbi:MAG: hypothetical protein H7Y07_14115 [Pyrinomonadaceae bacterium]|nr:hypothetical protein [Sphingobacteriaceae bacterium]
MKTTKLFMLLMILVSGTIAIAQTEKYTAAMQKGLASLDSSKTSEDFLATANNFERISLVEKKEWLPVYYAAYANLMAGILVKENSMKDPLFDKSLEQIAEADSISKDNSEILTVMGYARFMKMTVDPQARAMQMIGMANGYLEKAKALDPSNPRPYFVSGQNTFYTPEAFGGGKKNAKPMLQKAADSYEKFSVSNPLAPNWGKKRCSVLLKMCQ